MQPKNSVRRFLIKFVLIFAFLNAPIPIWNKIHDGYTNSVCNSVLGSFMSTGFAEFKSDKKSFTLNLVIANKTQSLSNGKTTAVTQSINMKYRSYLPLILLVTLILSTPFSARSKAINLLIAALSLTLILIFKQWIQILVLCEQNPFLNFKLDPAFARFVWFTYENFVTYPGPSLIISAAIWIMMLSRNREFTNLFIRQHQNLNTNNESVSTKKEVLNKAPMKLIRSNSKSGKLS